MKYWARNDEMKLADTRGVEAEEDPFKTEHHPKRSKYLITDKVTQINHQRFNDKIGDPSFLKGWQPSYKWSE